MPFFLIFIPLRRLTGTCDQPACYFVWPSAIAFHLKTISALVPQAYFQTSIMYAHKSCIPQWSLKTLTWWPCLALPKRDLMTIMLCLTVTIEQTQIYTPFLFGLINTWSAPFPFSTVINPHVFGLSETSWPRSPSYRPLAGSAIDNTPDYADMECWLNGISLCSDSDWPCPQDSEMLPNGIRKVIFPHEDTYSCGRAAN